MMDKSKTPLTHLGSCRYLTLYRGVLDLSIIQPFSITKCLYRDSQLFHRCMRAAHAHTARFSATRVPARLMETEVALHPPRAVR
jgi:hypothetical protein